VPIDLLGPAQPGMTLSSPGDLIKAVIRGVADIANFIMSGADLGDVAFAKLLLFILLIAVLYPVAKKIPAIKDNNAASIIVAVIVSLLGVYFLKVDQGIINAILLPYGTLAIAVSVLIPLILFAYFVEGINILWIRKISWIVAIVAFIGLWIARWNDIGDIASYLYGGAAAVALLMLFFDGTIRRWRLKMRIESKKGKAALDKVVELQAHMGNLIDLRASPSLNPAERKSIRRQIDDIEKRIGEISKLT
jgi:hypothetical protein